MYGVVFGFIFLFFLFGLFVGRERFVEANPHSEDRIAGETPVQNVKTQLDFYSALKDPTSEQSPIDLVQAGSETGVPEEQIEENVSDTQVNDLIDKCNKSLSEREIGELSKIDDAKQKDVIKQIMTDILATYLHSFNDEISQINNQYSREEIINNIFSGFCVGK